MHAIALKPSYNYPNSNIFSLFILGFTNATECMHKSVYFVNGSPIIMVVCKLSLKDLTTPFIKRVKWNIN